MLLVALRCVLFKVLDTEKAAKLWKYSAAVTGAEWPLANQPRSPCPTLKVIGAVTSILNKREELERMAQKGAGVVAGQGKDILASKAAF